MTDNMTKENMTKKDASAQEENFLVELFKTLITAGILAIGIRTFVAEARYIPSSSMETTLEINDRLIIEKIGYLFKTPARGDIVVFNPTKTLQEQNFKDAFIKRVVALPGEQVEIKQGKVLINGKPLTEEYTYGAKTEVGRSTCNAMKNPYLSKPEIVPPNSYLVLGDNRNNSYDGRCWGVVPRDKIIGRAMVRFWPLDRIGAIEP